MLVVNDGLGDRLEGTNDAVLDQCRRFRHAFGPVLAHQVELEASKVPLTTQPVIVLTGCLLDGYVRQVHVGVLNFIHLVRVAVMREPSEPRSVQIDRQWLIASDQYIDSQIELLAAYEQWIHYILLHDVRFRLRTVRLPPKIVLPLADLRQLVQQKDSAPL